MSGTTIGETTCEACGFKATAIIEEYDDGPPDLHVTCDNCGYELWGSATETQRDSLTESA